MLLNEYQELAARSSGAGSGKSAIVQILTAGLGLVGEAAEIGRLVEAIASPREQMAHEIGDCLWYVADLATLHGLALQDLAEVSLRPADRDLMSLRAFQLLLVERPVHGVHALAALRLGVAAGQVADYLKKVYGHDHPLDTEKLIMLLGIALNRLVALASTYNLSMNTVGAANIAKLRKRYPDGFSSEASIGRQG